MKRLFIFLITMQVFLFSVIYANSKKEGDVEIEVELEVIKNLSIQFTPMHFGDCLPGETNKQAISDIEVQGESNRGVFIQFIDKNNSSNDGYIYLINQGDQTKKQRVDLRLQKETSNYLYIGNGVGRDKIIGTIDKVVNNPGYYEGTAIVKVRYE